MKPISALIATILLGLAACTPAPPSPESTRQRLLQLLPVSLHEREAWAADIQTALTALDIEPSDAHLCAVLAVTEQESTFTAQPAVPGLGKIALKEIDTRAQRYKIPAFAVKAALRMQSPNGESWEARIAKSRTEKELSDVFEAMTGELPLGSGKLLARANPVRTGGPMQVSIAYAEAHARSRDYPYGEVASIRHEVFTRRGGMYFGIAHLLDYEASYTNVMFRFADFNAGHYASRNAAFQNAIAVGSGQALDLDGDLLRYDRKGRPDEAETSATEQALRKMSPALMMDADSIRKDLQRARRADFERTQLYRRVYEVGDARNGKPLPRATLPRIQLHSPKITRKLTTEWFATRVNGRWKKCMARAARRPPEHR